MRTNKKPTGRGMVSRAALAISILACLCLGSTILGKEGDYHGGGDGRGGTGEATDSMVDQSGPESQEPALAELKAALSEQPAHAHGEGCRFKNGIWMCTGEPKALVLQDRKFYADVSAKRARAAAAGVEFVGPELVPLADTFRLHSNPNASKTVYLDFDGNITTGTSWNTNYGVDPLISPAYDPDGNGAPFTDNELARIQRIWQRVAEDYSPFDINVTTEDPGEAALVNTGGADTEWGIRVVFTIDNFDACGCGGIARIDSFTLNYQSPGATDTPVFAFNTSEIAAAGVASHEIGHSHGLSHDGTTSDHPTQPNATYYYGHGSGETGWGPIMGAGYYTNVTTWDLGGYFGTNNDGTSANFGDGADDIAIMTSQNGFGFRPDDHGDELTQASSVTYPGPNASDPSLADITLFGVIGDRTDLDFIRFDTGEGMVDITIDSYLSQIWTSDGAGSLVGSLEGANYDTTDWSQNQGSNLDVEAKLYDSAGQLLATSNPAGLSASFNQFLAAGTYFISVDGVGTGSPSANPPSGYTDYSSIGQYLVSGTVVPDGLKLSAVAVASDKNEGDSATTEFGFNITMSEMRAVDVTVDWTVSGSGASPASSSDFGGAFPSGTEIIPAGSLTTAISIQVSGDTAIESDETFTVLLSNLSEGQVFGDGLGTIRNDDVPLLLFADSFEGPEWGNLWVEDSQNDWFRSTQRAADGSSSAEVDGRATNATLTLNNSGAAIDITGYPSATLTFDWLIENGFDAGDFLALDVSADGGTTWTQNVRQLNGNVDPEDVWHGEAVNLLPSFSGTNLKVRFRSSVSNPKERANVDTVRIVAAPSGPANQAPVAIDDSYGTDEDMDLTVVAPGVLSGDSDPEGDPLAAVLATSAANGSVVLDTDGAFVYTPNADFNGTDGFTYKAIDGTGESNIAMVNITVNPVNDAPLAYEQSFSVIESTPKPIVLTASDVDGDALTYATITGPTNGMLSGTAPNLTYTPDADYIGADSFTFKVNDGEIDSTPAQITITVQEVPSEVVLFTDSFEGPEWGNLWVEDSQDDWFRSTQRARNGSSSAEVDGRATNATLTLNNNGTPIDITGYQSATLTFDWLIESGFDSGEFLALDISADGGSTWTPDALQLRGNVDPENVWHSETVDLLPSFSGTNLMIRFCSSVDKPNEDANVDNVRIVASSVSAAPLLASAGEPSVLERSPGNPSLPDGSTRDLALVAGASRSTKAIATLPDGHEPGGGNVPAEEEAPGHIIVFKKNVNAQDAANQLRSQHGLMVGRVYQHAIKGVFVPRDLPPQALEALQKNPNVAYVEKNGIGELTAQPTPTGINRVDAEKAVSIDGVDDLIDVDIAVIDTGIDPTHPDLNVNHAMSVAFKLTYEGNGKKRRQVVTESHDVSDWADWNGHGTFVAGIAAATDNEIGVVGVAPGARVTAVQVGNETSWATSKFLAGLDYVAANADVFEVASISLRYDRSDAINDAVDNVTAAGVVVVCGSGNNNDDASNGSPASAPSAITVSAIADTDGLPGGLGPDALEGSPGSDWEGQTLGADDSRAVFTGFGPVVDIAAPGVEIHSTWLSGGYEVKSGTSTATPHVSGAVALYISEHGRDRDVDGAIDGNDVALMKALVKSTGWQFGDYEYFAGDTDGYPEPLLNVPNLLGHEIDQFPTVSITSPADGAVVSGIVSLQADASDNNAVTQVEFFVDGISLGIDSYSLDGYSLDWDSSVLPDGSHELSAVATDESLQDAISSVIVSVDNIDSAPVADAGSNLTVQDGDGSGSESVALDGSGSSDDRAVANYEWYSGSTLLGTGVSFSVDALVGSHTITLVVFDSIGQFDADSVVITVEEAPTVATHVSVESIAITGYGGKNSNNHIEAIANIRDDLGIAAVRAVVEAELYKGATMIRASSGTTDSSGAALLFNEKGIAAGCYSVVVTKVTVPGLTFDGVTPSNQYCK